MDKPRRLTFQDVVDWADSLEAAIHVVVPPREVKPLDEVKLTPATEGEIRALLRGGIGSKA